MRSYSEPWLDTSGTSPVADLMLNILASFAQFERALIAERVKAGMERARRQGKRLGRPSKVNGAWTALKPDVRAGRVSRGEAATLLGVSVRTVQRLLRQKGNGNEAAVGQENQGVHSDD